jgi:GTP-binding protein
MFVDRAIITVAGGHGGPGCIAFRREKAIPKGGPNGGDGGDGGSVILAADEGVNTLLDFKGRPEWLAENGGSGLGSQCTGPKGKDRVIRLPAGTLIYDERTGELIHDLKPGERVVIARGGRGGFGNEHFKSSINQTPRNATPGDPGEEKLIRLDLKLIADVGLVGMPNAGKSTILKATSRATPKIADYPFTTLAPQLGITELDPQRRLVLADIPGLIEGASHGAGLGHDFLRHIERTRIIVHVLDAEPSDGSDPAENYRIIRHELAAYSPLLADKDEVIALNKMDLLPDEESRAEAARALAAKLGLGTNERVFAISGAAQMGLRELLDHVWKRVAREKAAVAGVS